MQLLPMPDRPSDEEAQRGAARATFAMYRSYVDAGFDRHQAMQIVLELLRTAAAQQSPPKKPS